MSNTATAARGRTRDSWSDRLAELHADMPVTDVDEAGALRLLADYDTLGRLYRDILRVPYDQPRARGQRAPLDWEDGRARMRADAAERQGLATTKPFTEALVDLAGGVNQRVLADRVQLPRTQLQRLLAGAIRPTVAELEQIAAAFGKEPTYFAEYRVHLICSTMAESLRVRPERSIDILVRMGTTPDPHEA